MKTNLKHAGAARTHEGGPSTRLMSPAAELRRTVMASLLFEGTFYESGEDAAERMARLVAKVSFEDAAQIAIEAREQMKLRHTPLFLTREILRHHSGRKVGDLIARVIQRPDEMGELLALYWKDGNQQPLTAQLKVGLARALKKFSAYQLAKWNTDGAVKLRDVLFLSHARPDDEAQAALFRQIAENTLPTPDTWEVSLSAGEDKKQAFERLLAERKLGALALLRNLRGMTLAGVSEDAIRAGLAAMNAERVLPFRFIPAARHAPHLEDALEPVMFKCLAEMPRLAGKTALLIDHSGSMSYAVSKKSDITRFDAACGLAMILREICERVRIFAFSNAPVEVPPRRGFALAAAARDCMSFNGTYLAQAVDAVYSAMPDCERLIVITDEQSADRPPHPKGRGYIINVANYQHGIAYGPWLAIDGWSEAIVEYVRLYEEAA
jgi:60 kDa SS-A/Ro ribonucleoprotein